MQLLQQIKGVSQHEEAHHDPVSPAFQSANDAGKAETLIEKCLKSIIK